MRRVAWLDFGNGGSSKGRRFWQILLVATVLLRPVQASDQVIVTSSPPSDALARFFASQRQPRPRVGAMLEVSASLPKLNKAGRLTAIRRIPPGGQATYQIVHIDGDSVVKREILARYLVADSQARALSPAATAITPANYRYLYAGAVELPNHLAYAFRIISRKKRVGLLNGVVWVDAGTGSAVRISGHFVKTPSVLIKRIEITRQNAHHRYAPLGGNADQWASSAQNRRACSLRRRRAVVQYADRSDQS